MTVDEHNEVVKLLLKVGQKLNRSPEQIKPYIKLIVEDNWLESLESLKKLKNSDWDKLNLPIRFLEEIKQELYQKEKKEEIKIENELNDYTKTPVTEGISQDSNISSYSKNNNNAIPCRYKTKIEQIKNNLKAKDTNPSFSKKIKKNTCDDGNKIRFSNNIQKCKRGMESVVREEESLEEIEKRKENNKECNEFPFIKFNLEVYNELIQCGENEIEVENVFYFSNEYSDTSDDTLQSDIENSENYKRKCDKHSVDLYNAAEKLKHIDTVYLKGTIEVLSKIIRNILITPKIIKTRVLKCTNNIIKEKILKFKECVDFLKSIGFTLMKSYYVLQKVNCLLLICAYQSLENLGRSYSITLPILPKKYFNPYKASIISTDSFKAKTPVKNDNSDEILKQKKEELNKLMSQTVALNPKIYLHQRKSIKQSCSKEMDISDSDEDHNNNHNDDVSYVMSKIKNLYKEQTFQSKTKMEIQKIANTQIYVKTVLRILFPDQHILELNFSPSTTLKHVHECIQKFLSNSVASKEWLIYEPPLIKQFDLQKKLNDYNLVPCAFLRFKLTGVINNNIPDESFFSEEAMEKYYVSLP